MFGGIVLEKERGMKIGRLIGSVAALSAVPILAIGAYYHRVGQLFQLSKRSLLLTHPTTCIAWK